MHTESLISVAGLIGRPVIHKSDQQVGKLVDLVFRWRTEQVYPPLSGVVVSVGGRTVWIPAREVASVQRDAVRLKTAKLDLRDFSPREGEVRLVRDVLDHQLVDTNGARVVRASDLYVSLLSGQTHLVGVDVGFAALVRRLGPAGLRRRPPAKGSVIDWSSIHSFGSKPGSSSGLQMASSRRDLRKLRPGELADLLEDLGRDERQELLDSLDPADAADALEEMQPAELESILRESSPEEAAALLANMEPDEAADALRDVDEDLRTDLLALMPEESTEQVEEVLAYNEDTAGGFMTTAIMEANANETVARIREKLLEAPADEHQELDAIVVVDSAGKLVADLPIVELFLAEGWAKLGELGHGPEPVTVPPDASVTKAAELLIDNRRSSILVVAENGRPLGRILADDIIDAMMPESGRFRFPRVLTR